MLEAGILDPIKVTRLALHDVTSVKSKVGRSWQLQACGASYVPH